MAVTAGVVAAVDEWTKGSGLPGSMGVCPVLASYSTLRTMGRLAKVPDLASQFAEKLKAIEGVFVLPMLGLLEFSDGETTSRDERLVGLGRALKKIPKSSLRVAATHQELLNAELIGPLADLLPNKYENENIDLILGCPTPRRPR